MHPQPSLFPFMTSRPLISPQELRALLSGDALHGDEDQTPLFCKLSSLPEAAQPGADGVGICTGKA